MRTFKPKNNDFVRRTRRRIIFEGFIFFVLAAFFWSEWSRGLPNWLEVVLLTAYVASVLFDLVYYPKAKATAESFAIYLLDNGLGFSDQDQIRQIPYSDLSISKVIRRDGDVAEIRLKTIFGQSIKLRGLENMKELYEGITDCIEKRKNDSATVKS